MLYFWNMLTSIGSADIARAFQAFPSTAHPLITDGSKWVFECIPLSGMPDANNPTGVHGLIITVHGELLEHPNDLAKRKLRSFDRTFTLGPNKTGGIRVVNDALILRNYGGTRAFPQNAGAVQSEEQQKAAMVAELQRVTGMNAQYAELCLVQTDWKLEAALESFQTVKASGTIPPEAFA
jgi:nuclear RNA export factor